MRIVQVLAGAMFWIALSAPAGMAQEPLPDHRYVYTQDADFYGADLGPLFDTTRTACALACDAQAACIAFTYNTRSNACFPKSDVTEVEFFEGALSARKLNTPIDIQKIATSRKTDLAFLKESDFDAATNLVQFNADRYLAGNNTLEDILGAVMNPVARVHLKSNTQNVHVVNSLLLLTEFCFY